MITATDPSALGGARGQIQQPFGRADDPPGEARVVIAAAAERILCGAESKAGIIAVLAELLDVAGWGVAYRDIQDDAMRITERGQHFLKARESAGTGRAMDWQELLKLIPPESVELASPGLVVWRTEEPAVPSARQGELLTAREQEVLDWISSGKTAPEVAVILSCARRTVEKHIANIYRKLGVHDRTSLILNSPPNDHGV